MLTRHLFLTAIAASGLYQILPASNFKRDRVSPVDKLTGDILWKIFSGKSNRKGLIIP
jgi:hypothetical protein